MTKHGIPFNTLDEAAVDLAAGRSYLYEAVRKELSVIGWANESEEIRERWRQSVRVAVRAYLKVAKS